MFIDWRQILCFTAQDAETASCQKYTYTLTIWLGLDCSLSLSRSVYMCACATERTGMYVRALFSALYSLSFCIFHLRPLLCSQRAVVYIYMRIKTDCVTNIESILAQTLNRRVHTIGESTHTAYTIRGASFARSPLSLSIQYFIWLSFCVLCMRICAFASNCKR